LITNSKWLECVEWKDKEEALMDSDLDSISDVESLTPLEYEIHPSIEEDIDGTNPRETLNNQIRDEDNINEHGIFSQPLRLLHDHMKHLPNLLVSPTSPHLRSPTPSSFLFTTTLKGRLSMHMSIINIADLIELILIYKGWRRRGNHFANINCWFPKDKLSVLK